jgi:tetratricopeptide (TPR) repeat protein
VAEPGAALRRAWELLQAGQPAEAERACRDALSHAPHDPRLLTLYGSLLAARGAIGEAAVAIASALHADPGFVPALAEDAALALRQGDPRRALERCEAALARTPPSPPLLLRLAQAAGACGDGARMRAALEQAQALEPGEPHTGLALLRLALHQRRPDDAVRVAQAVLSRTPALAEAWRLLAEAHAAAGRASDALSALREGLRRAPEDPPLHDAFAGALEAAGAPAAERLAARERAALLAPTPRRLCELGLAGWVALRYDLAGVAFDRALALDGGYLPALVAGFQYPRDVVHADDAAVAAFRANWLDGLARLEARLAAGVGDPRDALAAATLCTNFYFHYTGEDTLPAQRRYARAIEAMVRAAVPDAGAAPPQRERDGRIRVAVFSAHLSQHTITRLFGAMLRDLDRSRIRIAFFQHGDGATIRETIARGDDLVVAGPRGPAEWAQAIRGFAPAVLLHTDLGMQPMAQCLAAMRLAPMQAVLWGHPVSTGLEHVDAFLGSELMDPPDAEGHYSERLVRLPGLGTCFAPPAREPRAPAGLAQRDPWRVEYLFVQSVFKNLPLHDRLLARIAARLPAARFHLTPHADAGVCARLRTRIEGAFAAAGLDPARHLGILRGLPPPEFLGLARAGDVNLDSIGWSGGNTTLEILWFGTPTVTLPGRTMRSRHTAAMLRLLELPQLVARDVDHYVDIAVELGRSADFRAEMRGLIEARKHRLYDDRAVVAALEAFCLSAAGAAA